MQIFAMEAEAATNVPAPAFADLRLGVAEDHVDGNFILRQPFLVGGLSLDAYPEAPDVLALGGFARPRGEAPGKGELIFGGNYVEHPGGVQWELQARYATPGGIGAGAGFVDDPDAGPTWFVSLSARGRRGPLHYHLSPLAQHGPGGVALGGYAALHGDHLFGSGGGDGEQWRALVAWSANGTGESPLDPSLEALFVDHSIGSVDGERFLFVNGSLRRNMGFLSTASRLGRALGPQGLQFANPVSFLSPAWSRTADVWETGEVLNVRLARRELPGGETLTLAQSVFFPLQALGSDGPLRGVFAGLQHEGGQVRSDSFIFGHTGRRGPVAVNAAAILGFDQSAISVALGIRVFF